MYIVYEHTRDKLSYNSGKGLSEYKYFGYIKDVLFFKTLPQLKQYVEAKTLQLLIYSETPYIQTENIKFAEKYVEELETNDKSVSCKFSDNYITINKLKDNLGMIKNTCEALDSFLYSRAKNEDFAFISTDGRTLFYKDDFFNYEERMKLSVFESEINRTDYFSKDCIVKIKKIIKDLHASTYYIEDFQYMNKHTRLGYFIDDVLLYNGEEIAYCRSFFGKTSLIKLDELIIL